MPLSYKLQLIVQFFMTTSRSTTSLLFLLMLGMMGNGLLVAASEEVMKRSSNLLQSNSFLHQESPQGLSLQERFLLAETTIQGLTENLVAARRESESFRKQFDEVTMRLEAFGVQGLKNSLEGKSDINSDNKHESKLLAAISDLRLLNNENEKLRTHLIHLSEMMIACLKNSETTDSSKNLKHIDFQKELKTASVILEKNLKTNKKSLASFTFGTIIDVQPQLSLVVADLGLRHGVNIGMPFQVWRGNNHIGSVKVVDVRDNISGAIVQNANMNTMNQITTPRPGDQLRVDLYRTTTFIP